MQNTKRLFIAINLPPSIQEAVAASIAPMQDVLVHDSAIHWIPPENLHLTLRFLSDTSVATIPRLKHMLNEAVKGSHPFKLELKQIGFFPSLSKARVVWLGLKDQQNKLCALHNSVQTKLSNLGYESEKRPFNAHLTIARIKRLIATDTLSIASKRVSVTVPVWCCKYISLMESNLTPKGARYKTLFEVKL